MKKLKKLLALSVICALVASCEKDDDNHNVPGGTPPPSSNPCTIQCQNGGTINYSNCSCDCPPGFTGTYCQTPVNTSTPIIVSLNATTSHLIKPIRTNGDNEFGGKVKIWGNVNLEVSSDKKKIYAVAEVTFLEPKDDYSTAYINPAYSTSRILLYTAPSGKKIDYINSSTAFNFTVGTQTNYHGTYYVNVYQQYPNGFLHKMEIIGDTSGDDLPSDGSTNRARFKIYFDDFSIVISNQ